MAIEVFNRYENKYMLSDIEYVKIMHGILDYMKPDAYSAYKGYTIANLYYDTPDSRLIRESLSKPKYKEKLRLRSYGAPEPRSEVYAEIKKKVRGLVNKRRTAITLSEAYEFLSTGMTPKPQTYHNKQVLNEISYILERRELHPALYLAYDRRAFFGADGSDLRISFDSNIRSRRYDLRLENGDYGERLMGEGQWLMEIKTAQSIPLWLSRLLSENKIYPTSFSKYGEEYKRSLSAEAPRRHYVYTPCPGVVYSPVAVNAY